MTLPGAIVDILPPDDRLRVGTISSIVPTKVNIEGTDVPAGTLGSYVPILGDVVSVLRQDGTWLILGRNVAPATAVGPGPQANVVSMAVAAAGSATQPVTFPKPFLTAPAVVTNFVSGAGSTAGWGSRAINITNLGFTMFIFGASSTFGADLQWIAMEYTS